MVTNLPIEPATPADVNFMFWGIWAIIGICVFFVGWVLYSGAQHAKAAGITADLKLPKVLKPHPHSKVSYDEGGFAESVCVYPMVGGHRLLVWTDTGCAESYITGYPAEQISNILPYFAGKQTVGIYLNLSNCSMTYDAPRIGSLTETEERELSGSVHKIVRRELLPVLDDLIHL